MLSTLVLLYAFLACQFFRQLSCIAHHSLRIAFIIGFFSITNQALGSEKINEETLFNRAPHLSKLLDHTIRPTMDEVYTAAKADGLFEDKDLIAHFESQNAQAIRAIAELFIHLEQIYPGFRFYTLGRDAVAYSDYFDALAIHLGKPQRAVRVNLSGESARHADPELLRQYLVSLGMPKDKTELFEHSPIVFMDYTQYDSTSQLRRLIEILLSSFQLTDSDTFAVKSKFVALISNNTNVRANQHMNRTSGNFGEAIIDLESRIGRATPYNGKFELLTRNADNSFTSYAGALEAPTPNEKKKSLVQMLGYLLTAKKLSHEIKSQIYYNDFMADLKTLLASNLPSAGGIDISTDYFNAIRDIVQSENTKLISKLISLISNQPNSPNVSKIKGFISKVAVEMILNKMVSDLNITDRDRLGNDPFEQVRFLIIHNLNAQIHLAKYFFSKSYSIFSSDLLELLVEHANSSSMFILCAESFSQPHTKHFKPILKTLVENADQNTLRNLATYTFSKPHTHDMLDLFRTLVLRANRSIYQNVISHMLSNPQLGGTVNDLVRYIIENSSPYYHAEVALQIFSRPHSIDMEDLMILVLEKADTNILLTFLTNVFDKKHTIGLVKAREAFLKKASELRLYNTHKSLILKNIGANLMCEGRL